MFDEFPEISKDQWIARIVKDLKGKDMEDIFYRIGKEVINPLAMEDDIKPVLGPIKKKTGDNSWRIAVEIDMQNPESRKLMMDALACGTESLVVRISTKIKEDAWASFFEDVQWNVLQAVFSMPGIISTEIIARYFDGKTEKERPEKLYLHWNSPYPDLHDSVFNNFDAPGIAIAASTISVRKPVDELVELILTHRKLSAMYPVLNDSRFPVLWILRIGKNTIADICKLRAFRILWANYKKAVGLPSIVDTSILAAPRDELSCTDPHQNLIQSTAMAIASVLGGSDLVLLNLHGENISKSAENQRHLINIQHILRYESQLDEVLDPLAGSYPIEHTTQKLVESAWKKLKNKV